MEIPAEGASIGLDVAYRNRAVRRPCCLHEASSIALMLPDPSPEGHGSCPPDRAHLTLRRDALPRQSNGSTLQSRPRSDLDRVIGVR